MQLDNPAGGSSMGSMVVLPTPAVVATISTLGDGAMTRPSLSTTRLGDGEGVGMPRGYRDTGLEPGCFGVAALPCGGSVRAL